jgi:glycosyltransferase involved in cell wall biosynthesis
MPPALFIAPIMPSDHGNGLAMRAAFLLDTYSRRFDIDLAVVPIAGGSTQITPFSEQRTHRVGIIAPRAPDTHFSLISRLVDEQVRLDEFRRYGRPSITAWLTAGLQEAVLNWVGGKAYTFIHVSRLYLSSLAAPWMGAEPEGPLLLLDCDEDDASAYRTLASLFQKSHRNVRAQWAEAESLAFGRMAAQWLPRFNLLLASSAREASVLRAYARVGTVVVVPNVVPVPAVSPLPSRRKRGARDILFVGNLDYQPNSDAVVWFATRIWPKIISSVEFPLRFVVIGPGASCEVRNLANRANVIVRGSVEDLTSYYRDAALAVVPIRAGGGTRIKLLEAAIHGVPIVTTSCGAAGTAFRAGIEVLIANQEAAFAKACQLLLTNRRFALRMAAQARLRASQDYNPKTCGRRLLSVLSCANGGDAGDLHLGACRSK